MTRRTLGLALLTLLGTVATQGTAMAKTPPEPDPLDPTTQPQPEPARPYHEPN